MKTGKFGSRNMKREKRIFMILLFLFISIAAAILIGTLSSTVDFETRNQAAGKTYFVKTTADFEKALSESLTDDAIFLQVGEYISSKPGGFEVKNKNIRILGAGQDFASIGSTGDSIFTVENAQITFEAVKFRSNSKIGVNVKNATAQTVSFNDVAFISMQTAISGTSTFTVDKSFFNQNVKALDVEGPVVIKDTVIEAPISDAITINNSGSLNIENSIIYNAKGTALNLKAGGNHIINNVTLYGNRAGIIEASGGPTTVSNSIIQNSTTGEGIKFANASSKVTYTNSFENKGGNYVPESIKNGTGNISSNANFVNTQQFHLNAGSPSSNTGDQTKNDSDGSRLDMGAHGGNPDLKSANGKPVVKSTPPAFVKVGETYSYEVVAEDPDKDLLTYTILNTDAPKWITQQNNKFTGTPNESNVGFAGIVLVVSDNKGHNIVHPININVVGKTAITNPTPTTPQTTPAPTPPTNTVPKLTFTAPVAGTVFKTPKAELAWKLENSLNIDKIVLKYSQDSNQFFDITTLQGAIETYSWDISQITPGKYLLKIEIYEKNSTRPIVFISEQFEIQSGVTGTLEIIKVSPQETDNVKERRPVIQVEFRPVGAQLDTQNTFLSVNGQKVEYTTTANTIFYQPETNIEGNTTTVEVKLVSTTGAEASKRWTFRFFTDTTPQDTTQTVTQDEKLLGLPKWLGLIIIGLGILLIVGIILFLIFRLLKTIRDERQGNLEAEFTEYYDPNNQGVLIDESQQNQNTGYSSDYYAPQTDYSQDAQNTTQTYTDSPSQPLTEYSADPYANQSNQYTNTSYTASGDTNSDYSYSTSQSTSYDQDQQTSPQADTNQAQSYADQSYDTTTYAAGSNTTNPQAGYSDPPQYDPNANQMYDQGNTQNNQPNEATDEYIESLKKKYAIDQEAPPAAPDPSQAATSPKNPQES